MARDRYIMLSVALISVLWINYYCLTYVKLPAGTVYPMSTSDRISYLASSGKGPALWLVLNLNRQFPDRTTGIYGVWLEDLRAYADFRLVGSIYGYAAHDRMADLAPVDLARWLEGHGCRYIAWTGDRAPYTRAYFDWRPCTTGPQWQAIFEPVILPDMPDGMPCQVWRIKKAPD